MENIRPHIVHLEDNIKDQEFVADNAFNFKKAITQYQTLNSFIEALKNDQNRPTLGYILDGSFPKKKDEFPEFYLPNAINFIRESLSDPLKILIYSGDPAMINASRLSDRPGIHFMRKIPRGQTKPVEKLLQIT